MLDIEMQRAAHKAMLREIGTRLKQTLAPSTKLSDDMHRLVAQLRRDETAAGVDRPGEQAFAHRLGGVPRAEPQDRAK
ncbi:MAG: hypothetical protein JO000_08895 [Alphaproteobacteria bacterium]|nr:hypothetical protein [Alphaproteobacteria bacterium]